MPMCDGTASDTGDNVPCADKRNDGSVRFTQGDLWLCAKCTEIRFPTTLDVARHAVNNELLYFVQNKCHALAVDTIVSICAEFYSYSEIEAARDSIANCSGRRLTKHKGGSPKEKCERTMVDIVKICVDPMVNLPIFYSINMARVPPVGVEHIDVSALVQEIAALRAEVRSFAAVRAEIVDIRTTLGAIGSAKQDVVHSSSAVGVVESDISMPINVLTGTNPATAAQSSNTLVAGASSFATMAKSLNVSGMTERMKKQKPKSVVGRSTVSSRVKAVVTKRQIDMFVSRLPTDTNDDDIKECVVNVMSGQFCNDVRCVRLVPKHADLYSSYHIAVMVESSHMKQAIELLNNADQWPEGLIVRRYFKPKNNG